MSNLLNEIKSVSLNNVVKKFVLIIILTFQKFGNNYTFLNEYYHHFIEIKQ